MNRHTPHSAAFLSTIIAYMCVHKMILGRNGAEKILLLVELQCVTATVLTAFVFPKQEGYLAKWHRGPILNYKTPVQNCENAAAYVLVAGFPYLRAQKCTCERSALCV